MSSIEILKIIFYFSGIVSIMLGGFTLYINPKSKINWTFFAVTCSLFFWAMGFSMSIDAKTMEECLVWRRVSALGWGSLFGFFLHFCMEYSFKKKFLSKWWSYFLIYLPAVLTVFVFSLSNQMAPKQYNLVRTNLGWTNISINNFWDLFFNVYYVLYLLAGLYIVWQYGKGSSLKKVVHQVHLLVYSFLAAFVLGTLNDILFNSLLSISVPQIAPIIMLLPVITVYYAIARYGLMNSRQFSDTEVILTKHTQSKVYSYVSITLFFWSIVSYLVQFSYYGDYLAPISSSVFLIFMGICTRILMYIKVEDNVKDILLIITVFFTIPIVILIFHEFGGVTVWGISFLFIIIAMVFNKPIVLVSISISVISTQILLWIMKPKIQLTFDKGDYIGRIGILCITIWIAYQINKIYIKRLKANSDQLILQKFTSEISSDIINATKDNIDEKIAWVIRILGKLFSIDRISILSVDLKKSYVEGRTIWDVNKKMSKHDFVITIPSEDISWMMNQLINSELIIIEEVAKLDNTMKSLKNWLINDGLTSVLAFPLIEKENAITILQFASESNRKWEEDEVRVISLISNMFKDALVKVEAEKEITFMAYHDHLTSLPNRRLLRDRLTQAIALAKRTEKLIGIIFIDVDSFKGVNDSLGHEGGDILLKLISKKLMDSVRQSDTVARFGGDEFLIMINNISEVKDILLISEKIMQILNQTYKIDGQEFKLTTSVGISIYPYDGTEIDNLIKHADIAMYKAKENGKNQYVLCTTELKEEVLEKIRITNSLHKALENEEFYLVYQPQVSLVTEQIIGLEALIRWNHPEMGNIPPGIFIPIAEQIGVINELGEWVLRTACHQNKEWLDNGYNIVCMAVNVSASQLRNIHFAEQVNQVILDTKLDPHFLELEITESVAMNESSDVIALMNEIRKLGIIIAIDDFGTDYSSLSRLKELPTDKIKIDKQFVDSIESSDKDKVIVKTIINLAKNMELRVIAEGVENETQLNFLKKELCDEVQGYYYYKPMTAEKISMILEKK